MCPQSEYLLETESLRVRFVYERDRFGHEVWQRRGGDWAPVLVSVEGTPEDDWPASPPFQSLGVEKREGEKQVALLVGMAGKSHWSASVQLDGSAGRLIFDVACRARTAIGRLGSCYQVAAPTTPESEAGDVRLIGQIGRSLVLSVLGKSAELRITSPSDLEIAAAGQADSLPATIRWGYQIQFDPA